MIPKLRNHDYLARVGVFLIALALIVGTVSCESEGGGGGGGPYTLTMAVAPGGSGNAIDQTNVSPYLAGTPVNIKAIAAMNYQFVIWMAPAGTFVNATAAETNFIMPAQDVTVTAIFVTLCDGGGDVTYNLTMAVAPGGSGNAIDQTNFSPYLAGTPVSIKAINATYYQFSNWTAPAGTFVNATAAQTTFIMPAQNITVTANFARLHKLNVAVTPLGGGTAIDLTGASPYLAGTVVSIQATANSTIGFQFHSWTAPAGTFANATAATTTFTMPAMDVTVTAHFAVPQLDHFKCYDAVNATAQFILMDIEDQFCFLPYWPVFGAEWFCNPVMKNSEQIVKPDNHLTIYGIDKLDWVWNVEIVNQFGPQNLTVSGPVALAVPTWKLDPGVHEPPVYFDHFLLYEVIQGSPVDENVDLDDQFPGNATGVNVTMPRYFANPVLYKGWEDLGRELWVYDPDAHLVFYEISDNPEYYWGVNISNRLKLFELQSFGLNGTGQLLAVPSEKLYYEEIFP
jgi:hypothetical protein